MGFYRIITAKRHPQNNFYFIFCNYFLLVYKTQNYNGKLMRLVEDKNFLILEVLGRFTAQKIDF